jgi:anti-anti-sigma factor
MSDVTFLVSLVLKMLFAVANALDHRGAKMALVSPQPAVAEVLKVFGFDQLILIHNEEGTALAFFAVGEGR